MSVDFWDLKKLYETSSMFGEGSLGIKVSQATQVKKGGTLSPASYAESSSWWYIWTSKEHASKIIEEACLTYSKAGICAGMFMQYMTDHLDLHMIQSIIIYVQNIVKLFKHAKTYEYLPGVQSPKITEYESIARVSWNTIPCHKKQTNHATSEVFASF